MVSMDEQPSAQCSVLGAGHPQQMRMPKLHVGGSSSGVAQVCRDKLMGENQDQDVDTSQVHLVHALRKGEQE